MPIDAPSYSLVDPRPTPALSLLTLPYIFTQDRLLTADQFVDEAKNHGHDLSLAVLQDLHCRRLLLPLYRVSDLPVEGRRIEVQAQSGMNARGWTLEAAAEGRLRDAADEGYSAAWPYERPSDEKNRRWWNGFVYSFWQLLNLDLALGDYRYVGMKRWTVTPGYQRRAERRRVVIALAALSTLYLPGVLRRLSLPSGTDQDGLLQYRAQSDVRALLRLVGFKPADLQTEADALLGQAHREPLSKWLPLLRHASYDGWYDESDV